MGNITIASIDYRENSQSLKFQVPTPDYNTHPLEDALLYAKESHGTDNVHHHCPSDQSTAERCPDVPQPRIVWTVGSRCAQEHIPLRNVYRNFDQCNGCMEVREESSF